jgi:hypothetical protein
MKHSSKLILTNLFVLFVLLVAILLSLGTPLDFSENRFQLNTKKANSMARTNLVLLQTQV